MPAPKLEDAQRLVLEAVVKGVELKEVAGADGFRRFFLGDRGGHFMVESVEPLIKAGLLLAGPRKSGHIGYSVVYKGTKAARVTLNNGTIPRKIERVRLKR